jgi:undecaprenol kinase
MDLKDSRAEKPRLAKSFYYAMEGILHTVKHERNMQIHTVSAVLVVLGGCWFHVSVDHWIILSIMIGGIFSLELMNTAIEKTVDLITDDYHPLAKIAKDAAAGAVLVYAAASVIVGVLIFSKYIF